MKDIEANIEKYLNHLQKTGYDKLRPIKNQPVDVNELAKQLGKAGFPLLEADNKKSITNEKSNLASTLGEKSINCYVRARTQILNALPADRRARIELMEQDKKINNPIYDDFVKAVMVLGDNLP